ncbi:MAG: ABC transporter ATP-binding protein [Candidatus Saccharibacteria bacterium]|nr:ABC transporter ATP-binding protein [Candidatus Saccharibacteria bacterium]
MVKGKKKVNYRRTLHYFWKALMQHKTRTAMLLILIPIRAFIFNIVMPWGTSQIIGMLSAGDFEIANYTEVLLLTLLPVALNNIVLVRIGDWLDWSLDAKCGEYLSQMAFNAVINQSMTFHSNHFSGSLTSQVNKFAGAFIDLKSNFVWDLFPLILMAFYSIGAAFLVCPPFALILILFVALYATVAVVTYMKTTHVEASMAEAENKQTGQLADAVTNVISVKSYAREKFEHGRFARATNATKRAIFNTAKVSCWRNLLMNLIGTITFAVVLVLVIMSHNLFGLSIASAVFLYSISNTLLNNVWELNHVLRVFNRAFGNASDMVEILDMPYIVDDKTDKSLVVREAAIDFRHISFQHSEQKERLFSNFTLTIPAGKSIGLVGVSGSGKSTLTKLLLRFDDVKAGAIYIDGQDIRDVTQNSLREAIAYVPQESSLFHRTIFENIAYGRPGASEEEIMKAAKLANVDEFIKKLPQGYQTMVGERGVKLSGGQRQRIAIARAILKDAPILVLDEATSALDSESEALIQEALSNLMKGRTSIVVAHRLSTIAGLDEIVVLNDGKIVEQGEHAKLLERGGEYARLWSRQSGAFLEND